MHQIHKRTFIRNDNKELLLYGYQEHTETPSQELDVNDIPKPHMRWNPSREEWVTYSAGRKDRTYFEALMDKGQIEIAPLSYIRGRTFNNAYIIVDEAQNATIHELKTVITRIGENSKIVLMGDTDQIDTPYIDKNSNGLSLVIDRTRESNLTSHVHLSRGERSELATYASKVLWLAHN